MKTGRVLFLSGIIIIGIIIYVNKFKDDKASSNVQGQKPPVPMAVNGMIIKLQSIEDKIYASGTLLANDEVDLRNEIPGKITSILFKEGTIVKKGELLITLYDDDLQAQLKKLQLQKDIAQRTEERQNDLLAVNGISKQEYEFSLNQLLSIYSDIDLVKSNLSKTKIVAPFDGIIGLKSVSIGAFLSSNTKIATIQAVDPIKLEFSIPERYRSLINDTSTISFTTESTEGIFEGKIYAIEPKIDLQTRTFMVRAICSNKDYKLFAGAFAQIEIPLKKIERAIMIPTQALIPELKSQKVFVSKNGVADKVDVVTGLRNDSSIQITNGINEGDTIVLTGLMQMRPGMPVQVNVKSQPSTLN